MTDPRMDRKEAFDAVLDGAQVIDPDRCALVLFVTDAGFVSLKSRLSPQQLVDALRQLTARAEAQL